MPRGFRRSSRVIMLGASLAVAGGLVALPQMSGASPPTYYLSLGDSYSVGYQPNMMTGGTGVASSGYTAVVAAAKGYTLENFGCGGATTASILTFPDADCGIPDEYGPPAISGTVGPFTGTQTQVQAADAFIAAHPNQIGLITVSIGGNDVTPCAGDATETEIIGCVATATTNISANVTTLVGDLRGALDTADGIHVGKKIPIIGLTYPDVLLGLWVNTGPGGTPANTPTASSTNKSLASLSQTAFSSLINPALQNAYKTGKAKFVNVTKKTGGFTKLTRTVHMDIPALGLGTITVPRAVDEVCTLTWYCQFGNIHANDTGYTDIGNYIVAADK